MTQEQINSYQINKAGWAPGPWKHEPDRFDFHHAGFACLMLRNSLGVWCGYVGVPPSHSLHGVDYSSTDLVAHGGLTYSSACRGDICHVPRPGEPDAVWWFGFDCGHHGDLSPGLLTASELERLFVTEGGVYRTIGYAKQHVEHLAEQLTEQPRAEI